MATQQALDPYYWTRNIQALQAQRRATGQGRSFTPEELSSLIGANFGARQQSLVLGKQFAAQEKQLSLQEQAQALAEERQKAQEEQFGQTLSLQQQQLETQQSQFEKNLALQQQALAQQAAQERQQNLTQGIAGGVSTLLQLPLAIQGYKDVFGIGGTAVPAVVGGTGAAGVGAAGAGTGVGTGAGMAGGAGVLGTGALALGGVAGLALAGAGGNYGARELGLSGTPTAWGLAGAAMPWLGVNLGLAGGIKDTGAGNWAQENIFDPINSIFG